MKFSTLTAVCALAVALTALPAYAADLGDGRSVKDGYRPMMPVQGPVSNCYFRGDVGGSFSADPNVKWPMSRGTYGGDNNPANGLVDAGEMSYSYVGDKVSNASLENTWLLEAGVGCGSGSRGLRAEFVLGYRGERSLSGTPLTWSPGENINQAPGAFVAPTSNDLHSSITTYTAMLNAYYDLGRFGGFVPYVGAGIGIAYHQMHEVSFTGNPYLTGVIAGDNDVAFAWSVMAGVGYQLSDRAILDFGYRYIDMGSVASARHDNGGVVTNPKVVVDDITAHEFKIGLRYHIGYGSCCSEPMPLK